MQVVHDRKCIWKKLFPILSQRKREIWLHPDFRCRKWDRISYWIVHPSSSFVSLTKLPLPLGAKEEYHLRWMRTRCYSNSNLNIQNSWMYANSGITSVAPLGKFTFPCLPFPRIGLVSKSLFSFLSSPSFLAFETFWIWELRRQMQMSFEERTHSINFTFS